MKKLMALVMVLGVLGLWSVQDAKAANVKINITQAGLDAGLTQADMDNLATQFNGTDIEKLGGQTDLAKAMANANGFASMAGSLPCSINYDLFSISAGAMIGAQVDDVQAGDVVSEIEEEGDVNAGVSAGLALINVGLNSSFLVDGLYLNAKFGYLSLSSGDFSYKSILIGIGAQYTLVKPKSILFGSAKWNGLVLGTGVIYNKNEATLRLEYDAETELGGVVPVTYSPEIDLNVDINTVTVPLEIFTSARLLYIVDLGVGVGADFIFGSSEINIESESAATASGVEVGTVTLEDAGTDGQSPTIVKPKIMAAVGFSFGPVKIQMPGVWYPTSGYAAGISAGIVW